MVMFVQSGPELRRDSSVQLMCKAIHGDTGGHRAVQGGEGDAWR